jgi:hypothetical protein
MRNALEVLIAGSVLLAGCTITVTEGGDRDAGGHSDDQPDPGTIEAPPAEPFLCPEWADRDPAEIEQLVQGTVEELSAEDAGGISSEAWQDEAEFSALISRVYEKAGCPLPEDLDGPALHSQDAPQNYCGPGHGRGKLFVPTVDDCLNDLCRQHDACYAMCSQPLARLCSFSDATNDCDQPFIAALNECEISDHWFASHVVIFVAEALDTLNPFSCEDTECPNFGDVGEGPCSTDFMGDTCGSCLGIVDTNSCANACVDDDEPAICVAANCPTTAQCFGGYAYGALPPAEPVQSDAETVVAPDGGTASTDGGVLTAPLLPDSTDVYTLTLLHGVLPPSKLDGAVWDGDGSAPEGRVTVTLTAIEKTFVSSYREDNFEPVWNAEVAPLFPPQISTEISFVVDDVDVFFDDHVGTCSLPYDAIFRLENGPLSLKCEPPDLNIWIEFNRVP